MKQGHKWNFLVAGLAVGVVGLAGCQDKNNNGLPDSPATTTQIENKVDAAATAVEKGADKAAVTIEKGTEKGVNMAGDAAITGKVKSALLADTSLKATAIDVTTKNDVVMLDGTVPTDAQRALASKIAKDAAGSGHPIKNNLKVVK